MVFQKKNVAKAKTILAKKGTPKKMFEELDDDLDLMDSDSVGGSSDDSGPAMKTPKGKQGHNNKRVSFQLTGGKNTPAKNQTPKSQNNSVKKQQTPGKPALKEFKGVKAMKLEQDSDDDDDDDEEDDDLDLDDFDMDVDDDLDSDDKEEEPVTKLQGHLNNSKAKTPVQQSTVKSISTPKLTTTPKANATPKAVATLKGAATPKNSQTPASAKKVQQKVKSPKKESDDEDEDDDDDNEDDDDDNEDDNDDDEDDIDDSEEDNDLDLDDIEASPQKAVKVSSSQESTAKQLKNEKTVPVTGIPVSNTLYIGNLPLNVSEEDIKKLSSDIVSLELPAINKHFDARKFKFCFVNFASEAKAQENLKILKNKKLRGKSLIVDFRRPSRKGPQVRNSMKLRVAGLPEQTTMFEIAKLFPKSNCIDIIRKSETFAYVVFKNQTDASEALKANTNTSIGGKRIFINYALVKNPPQKKRKRNQGKGGSKPKNASKKLKLEKRQASDDDDDDDDDDAE